MNRAEMVRRLVMYEAVAKQIKSALKEEGRLEHTENGTAATWRMPYATVAGSQSHDRIEVIDPDKFMAYLVGRYPTEVQTVKVQVVRNPEWLTRMKEVVAAFSRDQYNLAPAEERQGTGAAVDTDGTIIPGAEFVTGGEYITTSVTANMTARRRAIAAAKRAVLMGDWAAVEEAISDPDYLTRTEDLEPAAEPVNGSEMTVTNAGFADMTEEK